MGIEMPCRRIIVTSERGGLRGEGMNDDAMRYSRYANTYRSRTGDPAMSAIRVGVGSRRTSHSGIQVRRVPARTARHGMGARKGKLLVVCVLVVGFLCASYFASASAESMAPMLGGNGKATTTAAASSTPQSEWKRGATPALYQTDPQWASTSYANDTLEKSGCGPTCLSMVYVNLTGRKEMDPPKMCAYSERMGFVDKGATSWEFMTKGARGLGLNAEELPADKGMIKGRVSAGHPVIAIMGPGDFTTTGHFIVICGIDENGRAIIRDPNSAERTNKPWDLDKLIAQARKFWAYSV